jgi:CHAT domain-containing protein
MRCRPRSKAFAWIAAALVASAARSTNAQDAAVAIDPAAGAAIAREIAPGRTDRYTLRLDANQSADLIVGDSDGLTVAVADTAGAEKLRLDRETTPDGAVRLCWVAAAAETDIIMVTAPPGVRPRRYTLHVVGVRAATETDRARAAALAAFAEADRLLARRSASGYREAVPLFERAAAAFESSGDRAEAAMAFFRLAQTYSRTSQYLKGVEANLRSAALRHEIGDRRSEGTALHNAGAQYYSLADYASARRYYEAAATLRREADDRNGEAYTLVSLGEVEQAEGDLERALEHKQQATALWQALGDKEGEAIGLNDVGNAYRALGYFQDALTAYTRAVAIRREVDDKNGIAQTLLQVGNLHLILGDVDRALEAYEEALPLRRLAGAPRGEAYILSAMGSALTSRGDWTAALERLSAAANIFHTIGDRDGEAQAMRLTGRLHLRRGDAALALDPLNRALELSRGIGGRRSVAYVELALGDANTALGRAEVARDHYQRAWNVFHVVRDRQGEAASLAELAMVERRLDRLDEARAHAAEAIALIESLRAAVVNDDLRTSYLAAVHTAYVTAIDVEMALDAARPGDGHAAIALAISERARARGLVDLLTRATLSIDRGVDPELVARERQLGARIEQATERLARLVNASNRADDVARAERAADDLITDLRDVEDQIRTRSPQYAALMQPPRVDAAAIQHLLDADTVLVEYALGGARSYAWVVTPRSLRAFTLPPQPEIERAAARAYDLLSRGVHRATQFQTERALAAVASLVLTPLAATLTAPRVVVVAEGALQYVPFGALPIGSTPLMARHEVVMLPSASTLDAMRRGDRGSVAPVRELAVFADPALGADHPAAGGAALDRLPFTRAEADAIVAFAPRARTVKAVDVDATRAAALAELGQSRIIHFATHALIDDRRPELSGIVLSLVDRDGRPVDGFLRLHEVYNMPLAADLVVLSACRTALGKDVRGEGLVGLTRGFLYGGASAVVASLWDVRDRSTAELMTRFYRAMFRDGLRPAAALRAAQASMWRDPRWAAAGYWAGFTIQGDWQ